jgi:SAM-dependent methyltransferase
MTFRLADFYDTELRRLQPVFRSALAIGRGDRVLDIGCGAGETTREAARMAVDGHALGVDISDDLLQAARQRSADEGLHNIAFERGDAQMHEFPPASFDVCISRFGMMFFADPAAAFANVAHALRRGARAAFMVWQAREHNAWSMTIPRALGQDVDGAGGPAFSLADRTTTTRLLADAGFDAIAFADVRESVCYGATIEAARDAVAHLFDRTGALRGEHADAQRARLDRTLERHLTADGVLFDARAWIITARHRLS